MRKLSHILFYLLIGSVIISCKSDDAVDPENKGEITNEETFGTSKPIVDFQGSLINEWNSLQLKLIQSTPGYSAPVAARSIAYTNLALYETAVFGMPEYKSLVGEIEGLTELPKPEGGKNYNWAIAANAAQYTILRELFSTGSDVMKGRIDTLRRQQEVRLKASVDEDEVERSIRFGASIAQAIWEFSKNDGAHEAYTNNFPDGYVRMGGAGTWRPTSGQKKPLLPEWGKVRPFITANVGDPMPMAKPFSFEQSSEYFKAAQEVYTTINALNQVQIDIMEFWHDGEQSFTPVGHHLSVINSLSRKESFDLEKMILLNLQTGLAFHDASIANMKTKYTTDVMRPVTYIQQTIDPFWNAKLKDDSSPEFTSLPATIAGAASTILTSYFGMEYTFEDETYASALGKKAYTSFDNYAKEASLAHFYAGNHLRVSCEEGVKNGVEIAGKVLSLPIKKETTSSENM